MPFPSFVTLTLSAAKGRGPDLKRLSAPSGAEPALSAGEGHPQGDTGLR